MDINASVSASPAPAWLEGDQIANTLAADATAWARSTASCPYSGLAVGVAALAVDGVVYKGANLESAAFSLTVHAETAMLVSWHAAGALTAISHLVCCDGTGALLAPCGACRQLLIEQLGAELLVATPSGWLSLAELLPWNFGAADLPAGRR